MKTAAKTTDGPRHQIIVMETAWNTEGGENIKTVRAKAGFRREIEERRQDFYN